MTNEQIAELVREQQKTQRSVFLALPDTPENRDKEKYFDRLELLLGDQSEGAVKLMAEIAEFVQFGRLYMLTIQDMGALEQPIRNCIPVNKDSGSIGS